MSLRIIKKNDNTFQHLLNGESLILSKRRVKANDTHFELRDDASVKRIKVLLTDVVVNDETSGAGDEVFFTPLELMSRLMQLGYYG